MYETKKILPKKLIYKMVTERFLYKSFCEKTLIL